MLASRREAAGDLLPLAVAAPTCAGTRVELVHGPAWQRAAGGVWVPCGHSSPAAHQLPVGQGEQDSVFSWLAAHPMPRGSRLALIPASAGLSAALQSLVASPLSSASEGWESRGDSHAGVQPGQC